MYQNFSFVPFAIIITSIILPFYIIAKTRFTSTICPNQHNRFTVFKFVFFFVW